MDIKYEKLDTVARSATSCVFKLEFPMYSTGFEEQINHAISSSTQTRIGKKSLLSWEIFKQDNFP